MSESAKPVRTEKSLNAHIETLKQYQESDALETGFDAEFNFIERVSERELVSANHNTLFKSALLAANRPKNRYSNVLPPESTRTKLLVDPNIPECSDYINASYINGMLPYTVHEYICTQGPLPNTIDDFWRMVWEKNALVIVMLTKEVENMRVKCSRYWPEEPNDAMRFGDVVVATQQQDISEELIVRHLVLQHMHSKEIREVAHFQYIAWPDHGLPPSTKAFLDLVKLVDESNSAQSPIIVHCSAGIGRSGTFCTVHSILELFKEFLLADKEDRPEPDVDIVQTVLYMREQRPGMVQTKEQYMFCYLAISEGIEDLKALHAKGELTK